ncbi:hypothetical protein [Fodinibius sediminis]|nr:hypothetical protein [Fodinibius sediminis]
MHHILRGDRKKRTGDRLDIDIAIFLKTQNQSICDAVDTQEMQTK